MSLLASVSWVRWVQWDLIPHEGSVRTGCSRRGHAIERNHLVWASSHVEDETAVVYLASPETNVCSADCVVLLSLAKGHHWLCHWAWNLIFPGLECAVQRLNGLNLLLRPCHGHRFLWPLQATKPALSPLVGGSVVTLVHAAGLLSRPGGIWNHLKWIGKHLCFKLCSWCCRLWFVLQQTG